MRSQFADDRADDRGADRRYRCRTVQRDRGVSSAIRRCLKLTQKTIGRGYLLDYCRACSNSVYYRPDVSNRLAIVCILHVFMHHLPMEGRPCEERSPCKSIESLPTIV